jgi:hypothetical protein
MHVDGGNSVGADLGSGCAIYRLLLCHLNLPVPVNGDMPRTAEDEEATISAIGQKTRVSLRKSCTRRSEEEIGLYVCCVVELTLNIQSV